MAARRLNDQDAAVRYWATLGIALRGDAAVRGHEPALTSRLADPAAAPRIAAAEALARAFEGGLRQRALDSLLATPTSGSMVTT